ncbi:hypothetical protein TYRP_019895 [Tyrophagus putrescentiae]|nr:hypothetical protein TYRP_019895 [Tyrophagus putrescentiae]
MTPTTFTVDHLDLLIIIGQHALLSLMFMAAFAAHYLPSAVAPFTLDVLLAGSPEEVRQAFTEAVHQVVGGLHYLTLVLVALYGLLFLVLLPDYPQVLLLKGSSSPQYHSSSKSPSSPSSPSKSFIAY